LRDHAPRLGGTRPRTVRSWRTAWVIFALLVADCRPPRRCRGGVSRVVDSPRDSSCSCDEPEREWGRRVRRRDRRSTGRRASDLRRRSSSGLRSPSPAGHARGSHPCSVRGWRCGWLAVCLRRLGSE
jgi:hypothetical protein